jgi:hypothetical protein
MIRGTQTAIPLHDRLLQVGGGDAGVFGSQEDDACETTACQIMYVAFMAFYLFLVFVCFRCEQVKEDTYASKMAKVKRDNRQWVQESDSIDDRLVSKPKAAISFPSGTWRGYHQQNEQNWAHSYIQRHEFCTFALMASEHKHKKSDVVKIRGSGNDGLEYDLDGLFNRKTGRLVLTKTYKMGTYQRGMHERLDGMLGHTIEYKGTVQGSIEAGIRGTCTAEYEYSGEGTFHIWPCNLTAESVGIQNSLMRNSSENTPLLSISQKKGRATSTTTDDPLWLASAEAGSIETSVLDNECIVCFDQTVCTVLLPCRHIALCYQCAHELQTCPLCRSNIDSVVLLQQKARRIFPDTRFTWSLEV